MYSGAFRILNGTIVSISPDGKEFAIRDLATKKPVTVVLNESSAIHKLPPEMAARLAQHASAGARPGAPPRANPEAASGNEHPAMRRAGGGDISAMIDRLPRISLADLKPGEAVVISGVLDGAGGSQLIASNVIAGVEPILQAAPARRQGGGGESAGDDWGLGEMSAPQ